MNTERKIAVGASIAGLALMALGFYDINSVDFELPVAPALPVLGGFVLTAVGIYAAVTAGNRA